MHGERRCSQFLPIEFDLPLASSFKYRIFKWWMMRNCTEYTKEEEEEGKMWEANEKRMIIWVNSMRDSEFFGATCSLEHAKHTRKNHALGQYALAHHTFYINIMIYITLTSCFVTANRFQFVALLISLVFGIHTINE